MKPIQESIERVGHPTKLTTKAQQMLEEAFREAFSVENTNQDRYFVGYRPQFYFKAVNNNAKSEL